MVAAGFAANNVANVEQNCTLNLSDAKLVEPMIRANDKVIACSQHTTSTVVTNRDGSTTRTTSTSIECDTAAELAALHKFLRGLGMGI